MSDETSEIDDHISSEKGAIGKGSRNTPSFGKSWSAKDEQENLFPLGMSKYPVGSDAIHNSQTQNIPLPDPSSVLRQKNEGERGIICSDVNQTIIPGSECMASSQGECESFNSTVSVPLGLNNISQDLFSTPHPLNGQKESISDNSHSCTGCEDRQWVSQMEVQKDENNFVSCIVGNEVQTGNAQIGWRRKRNCRFSEDASHSGPLRKRLKMNPKAARSKPKKNLYRWKKRRKVYMRKEKTSMDSRNAIAICMWKLNANDISEECKKLYKDHFAWFRGVVGSKVNHISYKKFKNLVQIESAVAIVFNKFGSSVDSEISVSFILENLSQNLHINKRELFLNLTLSPLYVKGKDINCVKKFYGNRPSGDKGEHHWQGILYMRKGWMKLSASQDERLKCMKLFMSTLTPKSTQWLTESLCKTLHIPLCIEMVEIVSILLKKLSASGSVKPVMCRMKSEASCCPPDKNKMSSPSLRGDPSVSGKIIESLPSLPNDTVLQILEVSPLNRPSSSNGYILSPEKSFVPEEISSLLICNSEKSALPDYKTPQENTRMKSIDTKIFDENLPPPVVALPQSLNSATDSALLQSLSSTTDSALPKSPSSATDLALSQSPSCASNSALPQRPISSENSSVCVKLMPDISSEGKHLENMCENPLEKTLLSSMPNTSFMKECTEPNYVLKIMKEHFLCRDPSTSLRSTSYMIESNQRTSPPFQCIPSTISKSEWQMEESGSLGISSLPKKECKKKYGNKDQNVTSQSTSGLQEEESRSKDIRSLPQMNCKKNSEQKGQKILSTPSESGMQEEESESQDISSFPQINNIKEPINKGQNIPFTPRGSELQGEESVSQDVISMPQNITTPSVSGLQDVKSLLQNITSTPSGSELQGEESVSQDVLSMPQNITSTPSGSGLLQKKKKSPGGGKAKGKTSTTKEHCFLPLSMGWVRELVQRAVSTSVRADVYYHPPIGRKLRSMVEIKKYLEVGKIHNITVGNFSFSKYPLGYGPPYELMRNALNQPGPGFFMKKEKDIESPTKAETQTTPNARIKWITHSNDPNAKKKLLKKTKDPNLASAFKCGIPSDIWDDEVAAITNEVGETTGFEDWIANEQISQYPLAKMNVENLFPNQGSCTSKQTEIADMPSVEQKESSIQQNNSSKFEQDFQTNQMKEKIVVNKGSGRSCKANICSPYLVQQKDSLIKIKSFGSIQQDLQANQSLLTKTNENSLDCKGDPPQSIVSKHIEMLKESNSELKISTTRDSGECSKSNTLGSFERKVLKGGTRNKHVEVTAKETHKERKLGKSIIESKNIANSIQNLKSKTASKISKCSWIDIVDQFERRKELKEKLSKMFQSLNKDSYFDNKSIHLWYDPTIKPTGQIDTTQPDPTKEKTTIQINTTQPNPAKEKNIGQIRVRNFADLSAVTEAIVPVTKFVTSMSAQRVTAVQGDQYALTNIISLPPSSSEDSIFFRSHDKMVTRPNSSNGDSPPMSIATVFMDGEGSSNATQVLYRPSIPYDENVLKRMQSKSQVSKDVVNNIQDRKAPNQIGVSDINFQASNTKINFRMAKASGVNLVSSSSHNVQHFVPILPDINPALQLIIPFNVGPNAKNQPTVPAVAEVPDSRQPSLAAELWDQIPLAQLTGLPQPGGQQPLSSKCTISHQSTSMTAPLQGQQNPCQAISGSAWQQPTSTVLPDDSSNVQTGVIDNQNLSTSNNCLGFYRQR